MKTPYTRPYTNIFPVNRSIDRGIFMLANEALRMLVLASILASILLANAVNADSQPSTSETSEDRRCNAPDVLN